MQSLLDRCTIIVYYIFAFTALVFEPLYYLGCDWQFSFCYYENSSVLVRICKEIWAIYCKWDPLFYAPPDWLKIMCYVEIFIFGPLYLICAYGLQNQSEWLPYVALPFSGALFYSTVVYFGMEFVYPAPETDMFMVFIVNIPWSIFPIIMGWRSLVSLRKSHLKFK